MSVIGDTPRLIRLDGVQTLVLQGGMLFWENAAEEMMPVRENRVGLLPLLERPYVSAVADLRETGASESPVAGTTVRDFLIQEVTRVAFELRSDYWVSLALNWAEANPGLVGFAALMDLETDMNLSQRTRHHARRLRKSVS